MVELMSVQGGASTDGSPFSLYLFDFESKIGEI